MINRTITLVAFLLGTMRCLGQMNDLSLSNGILLPYAQSSEVNYDPNESGYVSMLRSSYFLGLNYRRKIAEDKWLLKCALSAGEERYSIRLVNEFIDFNTHPDLLAYYQPDMDYFHQTFLLSLEAERRFNLLANRFSCSVFAGFYVNSSFQLPYSIPFRNQATLEIDGQQYYAYSELYWYPPRKSGFGLSGGFSIRRELFSKFYLEFLAQTMLRNTFEYHYDLDYVFGPTNSNTPQTYSANNQRNKINYSLVGLQLNFGITW